MNNISKFLNDLEEILKELSYRVPSGIIDLSNQNHLSVLFEILNEREMEDIGFEIMEILSEAEDEKRFENPILNKLIKYKDEDGNEREGLVGNLLRLKKDTEGRKAAERVLPTDDEERKEVLRDLGDEGQRGRDTNKEKEDKKKKDDTQNQKEQPQTGTSLSPTTKGGKGYVETLPPNDPAHQSPTVYHVGGGYYSDSPNGKPKYKKIEENTFTAIVKNNGDTARFKTVDSDKAENERREHVRAGISKKNQRKINDFKQRQESFSGSLSPEENKLAEEALFYAEVLASDNTTDDEKREAARWFIENMKLSTNSNGRKAYLNVFGGKRKAWSGTQGTNSSEWLVKEVSKYEKLEVLNSSAIKTRLSTAAKPNLGKENEVSAEDVSEIGNIFKIPPLDRIDKKDRRVYVARDKNGNPLVPSSKHSKSYLEQSFNSPSLDKAIEEAEELVKEGKLDKKFVEALKKHKQRLAEILKNYPIPSEEASQAVSDSYNEFVIELHDADSDMASSILKQTAEMRLYEEELARGEEVYLPSSGTFKGGDKISADGPEKVSLISVKFGKSGRISGCPANFSAISTLHPDKLKRNRVGTYIGEDGATLLIKDEFIRGETTEESIQKTSEFIKNNLEEVGLGDVFTEDEINEISKLITELREYIERVKGEVSGISPVSQQYSILYDKIKSKRKEISQKLGKIVSDEQLSKIVGSNNSSGMRTEGGGVPAERLLSGIEVSNNIRTSEGYGLKHNSQSYDSEKGSISELKDGTDNPNDYTLTWRTDRTEGRTGGGPQITYAGDSERPTEFLDDNGSTDEEGNNIEI